MKYVVCMARHTPVENRHKILAIYDELVEANVFIMNLISESTKDWAFDDDKKVWWLKENNNELIIVWVEPYEGGII